MWNYVGIVRKTKRLLLAKQRIKDILREIEEHYRDYYISANMIELRNISLVAMLIIEAALKRTESRGLHYIADFPNKDVEQTHWNIFKREILKTSWGVELKDKIKV